jgi:cytochrome c
MAAPPEPAQGPAMSLALALVLMSTPAPPPPDPVKDGRRLVETHCAVCHAIGRRGASANSEAPPFRRLAARYPVEQLQEALVEGILVGHPAMPDFAFSPDEADAIIAYIRTVQPRSRAPVQGSR